MKKNLYIVAGCNGAGKTTASFNSEGKHDLIAKKTINTEIDIFSEAKYN